MAVDRVAEPILFLQTEVEKQREIEARLNKIYWLGYEDDLAKRSINNLIYR